MKSSGNRLRFPHAEQILRGKKKIEYRNMPTNKRERVYIYASKTPPPKIESEPSNNHY